MTLKIEKKGALLTVTPVGGIDTITAPELEKALKEAWTDITELVFDFNGVPYVSSAGLRVIMEAERYMAKAGSMRLIHVCDDVRGVFEMTGFDELLDME